MFAAVANECATERCDVVAGFSATALFFAYADDLSFSAVARSATSDTLPLLVERVPTEVRTVKTDVARDRVLEIWFSLLAIIATELVVFLTTDLTLSPLGVTLTSPTVFLTKDLELSPDKISATMDAKLCEAVRLDVVVGA